MSSGFGHDVAHWVCVAAAAAAAEGSARVGPTQPVLFGFPDGRTLRVDYVVFP
jgi:hypothetical protein